MSEEYNTAIDVARERLKKVKERIDKNCRKSEMPEPDSFVSGSFDEVGLKRRQIKDDEDEK